MSVYLRVPTPEITVMATRNTEMILEKEALLLLAWHIKELVKIEKFLTSLFSEHYVAKYIFFENFQNGICTSLAPESGQVEILEPITTPPGNAAIMGQIYY